MHQHDACNCGLRAVPDNMQDIEWDRSIHAAAQTNDAVRVAKLLNIRHGIANKRDCAGYTPLQYASRQGNSKTVKILIDAGADALLETPLGHNSLYRAIQSGDLATVRLIAKSKSGKLCRLDSSIRDALDPDVLLALAKFRDLDTLFII